MSNDQWQLTSDTAGKRYITTEQLLLTVQQTRVTTIQIQFNRESLDAELTHGLVSNIYNSKKTLHRSSFEFYRVPTKLAAWWIAPT